MEKFDFRPPLPPPKKVYKLLIRALNDFGPDNWTSELRHFVPGFAPFQSRAFADFTYLDSQGQLTRNWFGPEKAAAWQGRWPRYHIEVKSTRGEEEEPFHMSPVQMATVRRSPPRSGRVRETELMCVCDRRSRFRSARTSAVTCTSSCVSRG
jgi:hypothetical protein